MTSTATARPKSGRSVEPAAAAPDRQPSHRARRWPRLGRLRRRTWIALASATLLLAVVAVPILLLDTGMKRATRCVATLPGPRSGELPDCEAHAWWFQIPEKVPWTSRFAQLYREELHARMAVARYVDAAVGAPNRALQHERLASLRDTAQVIREGTARLRLSQLGPTIPTPDVGDLAFHVGDRPTLTERGLEWTQWYASSRAIEAALLMAALPRAKRLAEHYAGRPDPDLRLQVGALLCLDVDPDRGLAEVLSVAEARADKRNANMARNFGSARVLVEACAHRAGKPPPPVPGYGTAGQWDHRERLAVMRLRMATEQPNCGDLGDLAGCPTAEQVREEASYAVNLLGSGIALHYRLELLAMVATLMNDGRAAAELARPLEAEPSPSSRTPLTLRRLVERDEVGQPFVHPDQLTSAAEHLLGLTPTGDEVRKIAGAMLARAAAAYAGLGKEHEALDRARRAAPLVLDDAVASALLVSSVAFLAGDATLAIGQLQQSQREARPSGPVLVAAQIQLAQLLALNGQHDDATYQARKAVATARSAGHPLLQERAAWVALALRAGTGSSPQGGHPPGTPVLQLPAVGPAKGLVSPAARAHLFEQAQDVWRSWLAAKGPARVAHRYAAFRHRGDAPEARVAHLVCAGKLADEPAQVEPWLDAFYAIDARTVSVRGLAWARAQAARWRGDERAFTKWHQRYRVLERWALEAADAELLQELRL